MAARSSAMRAETNWLESQFGVRAAGSTVGTEIRGGVTNYLVMSSILVVNAVVLGNAGIPFPAVVAATAVTAARFTACMPLWAKYTSAGAARLSTYALLAC